MDLWTHVDLVLSSSLLLLLPSLSLSPWIGPLKHGVCVCCFVLFVLSGCYVVMLCVKKKKKMLITKKRRVQTADKKHHNNPQVIHTSPVHQLTFCEAKSCVFVKKKSINCHFLLKYNKESSLHNIAVSNEKVVWSESGDKYAQIKHCLQVKTVLNKYLGGF